MDKTSFPGNFPPRQTAQTAPALATRVDELRASARLILPETLAANTGAVYTRLGPDRGELRLLYFGAPILITFPELVAYNEKDDRLPDPIQALLMYHFVTADGSPPIGKFISFANIPDGRMYAQAFQGYSGDEIAKAFDDDLAILEKACISASGKKIEQANLTYQFQALPQVPLQLVYWLGDEDFPSSCKILFDQSVSHHLPIDVCAILGSMLAGKIIKQK